MRDDRNLIGPWVRRFLLEHAIGDRNLAWNTQASYRDALKLLLPFVAGKARKSIDELAVEDLSTDRVLAFLKDLEKSRGCSVSTRNQRLAVIRALAEFIGTQSPEHLAWSGTVRSAPFKRAGRSTVPYLEKPEIDAMLAIPDKRVALGYREYAMLLFLYNTGARADEAARLAISGLDLSSSPSVTIVGKGNKTRTCPLWKATAEILAPLVMGRSQSERIFLNRCRLPITRFGVYALVKRVAKKAAAKMPSLGRKRVSPHVIRHTTAVHLLRAGVDINTIRAWLGHVSLDTTNVYAEVDLEMKAKALARCEIKSGRRFGKHWRQDRGLMEFLQSLQTLTVQNP